MVPASSLADSGTEAPGVPKKKGFMRVAAAQPMNRTIDFRLKPADVLAQVEKSLDELEQLVAKAGAAGCDALTLPEDTLGVLNWQLANRASLQEVLPQAVKRMLARLGRAAAKHRMYLVACNDTIEPDGTTHNTAYLLGRDLPGGAPLPGARRGGHHFPSHPRRGGHRRRRH
jgi:predicted amidohydrolase